MTDRTQRFAQEASAGSIEAFDELVRIFSARILSFCRSKSAGAAEDLAQEVFVTAFRRLRSYDPARPFGPWLFAVARRVAIDVSRRRSLPGADDEVEPADNRTPAEAASVADAEFAVWKVARSTLPARQLQVLKLRAGAGLSIAETAAAVGLSQTHVKVLLFRARRTLIAAGADQPLREGISAAPAVERGYL
jgi:RNA polymerase sigma-70 factor (ECF subfamily)